MEVDINELKKNLDTKQWLNDDIIDVFSSILKENEIMTCKYFQIAVEPAKSKKSIAILGGNCTKHWRVAYYDGSNILVYDSIPGYSGTIQPDSNSCSVYATAIASYILLKKDPSGVTFSIDVSLLRCHFLNILQTKKLSLFPLKNA
ncbi:hypothetical protein TSAR_013474 [Trichomalopsis sarcophagae]|uniref:Ubiquitin-like protease family profile domain-containing protein n=1 Tax=Trichomalopsis sarcophagae TaxID=543379 RepID=A0A232EET7_9HYME|nr:hypothetical protein TSAR_013474 [Trichomalopsis sarcophagae]